MNYLSNLHHISSNAIKDQIESMEEVIVKRQSNLCQQYKKLQDEAQEDPRKGNQLPGWTSKYKKWDNWEDTEEIEEQLKNERQTLSNMKVKVDTGRSSTIPFCCRGSQDRHAERKVARMTTKVRLRHMKSFRSKGNYHFEKGEYNSAFQLYSKSLIYYEYGFPSNAEEKELLDRERQICALNCAACNLQQKQYIKCIDHCTEVLDISTGLNVKALFRRAQAYRCLNDYDAAEVDLRDAKQLDRSLKGMHSNAIDKEASVLAAAINEYKSQSKVIAKRMLQRNEVLV